jgi:hypothetical protein
MDTCIAEVRAVLQSRLEATKAQADVSLQEALGEIHARYVEHLRQAGIRNYQRVTEALAQLQTEFARNLAAPPELPDGTPQQTVARIRADWTRVVTGKYAQLLEQLTADLGPNHDQ